jgi:hypothetical protein
MAPNNSSSASVADTAMTSVAHHPDARMTDPLTSWAAAVANKASRSRLRGRVLALLIRAGAEGMTDAELAAELPGQHPGSVSKRRCDLVRAGLVAATDRTRPTPYGQPALVWALSPDVKRWEGPPQPFCGCRSPEPVDRWCVACALPVLSAVVHWRAA